MSKDPTQKLLEYISLLEHVNEQLVMALKRCVEILTDIKPSVSDPDGWQEMLDTFQEIIRVGEGVAGRKTIH